MRNILERLPNEILEQIWKEALIYDVIDITPQGLSPPGCVTSRYRDTWHHTAKMSTRKRPAGSASLADLSALRRTCRYLYHEATRVFFSHNDFQIHIDEYSLWLPTAWLSLIPIQTRARVRNVTVICGAGNKDAMARFRKEGSFSLAALACLAHTPSVLKSMNDFTIGNTLLKLKRVEGFKLSMIDWRFERQTAGKFEWEAWRESWAQQLHVMSDVFTMPGRDVLGENACKRIKCAPGGSCGCQKANGDEAEVKARERKDSLLSE